MSLHISECFASRLFFVNCIYSLACFCLYLLTNFENRRRVNYKYTTAINKRSYNIWLYFSGLMMVYLFPHHLMTNSSTYVIPRQVPTILKINQESTNWLTCLTSSQNKSHNLLTSQNIQNLANFSFRMQVSQNHVNWTNITLFVMQFKFCDICISVLNGFWKTSCFFVCSNSKCKFSVIE